MTCAARLPWLAALGLAAMLASSMCAPRCAGGDAPRRGNELNTASRATNAPNAPNAANQSVTFRIAGTVVNARTGEPLPHARVFLALTSDRANSISMVTGGDGYFEFNGLKAAKYSLEGVKHGFLPAAYDQHEQYSTAIVTGPNFATDRLQLRLMPMALIRGHVYDEFGDGVRNARVALYYENRSGGMMRVTRYSASTTDDRGLFDFALLRPGNYYVAVVAKPWYAMHARSQPNAPDDAPKIPADLDVAYPTTYFGGATESEQATAIAVEGGDQQQVDVHLAPVPAIRVLFRAPENPEGGFNRFRQPALQKRVFDSVEMTRPDAVNQISPGVFEIIGVPAGRYTVRSDSANSSQSQISEDVNLARDGQELDALRSQSLASIKVTLKMLGDEPPTNPVAVTLIGPRQRLVAAERGDVAGGVTFQNVPAGTYEMRVTSRANSNYFVVSTSSAAGASSGHDVTVVAGAQQDITATVATGMVAIEGTVAQNDKPMAGAMVALVPRDPEQHVELFRRDQSDFDGSFRLAGVVPGTYTLVAVQDAWGFEWLKAGVLARYVQHGQEVIIGDLMRGTVHLPDAVQVQPR